MESKKKKIWTFLHRDGVCSFPKNTTRYSVGSNPSFSNFEFFKPLTKIFKLRQVSPPKSRTLNQRRSLKKKPANTFGFSPSLTRSGSFLLKKWIHRRKLFQLSRPDFQHNATASSYPFFKRFAFRVEADLKKKFHLHHLMQ